jgi:hypothetical protein
LTGRCSSHGGGKRCEEVGCNKGAVGPTSWCIAHGGGRRCEEPGCSKVVRAQMVRCTLHGGGEKASNSTESPTDSAANTQAPVYYESIYI